MSNEVESAVTSVTPTAPGRGPKVGDASTRRGGRPALLLKGGKPYAEARDEAKEAIRAAKRVVQREKEALRAVQKTSKQASRAADLATLATVKADAKPLPGKPEQKALIATLKGTQKNLFATAREADKAVAVQTKAVLKATTAYDKATKALLDVEAAKLKTSG